MTIRHRLAEALIALGLCWGILAACVLVALLWLVFVVRDDYGHDHEPRKPPRWP